MSNDSSFPQIELKQIIIYCDPYMAEMETCCEILEPKVTRRKGPPLTHVVRR